MPATIRQATPDDAPQWLDLLQAALGSNYPVKKVYDPAWAATQLAPDSGQETWVAEANGQLEAGISILSPAGAYANPITNIARNFFRTQSHPSGAAQALVRAVNDLAAQRGHWIVVRVLALDIAQQILLESEGYICVGFQPQKHANPTPESVLFYLRMGPREQIARLPLSESMPQINELANIVLTRLNITPPQVVRDGATGYPVCMDLIFHEASMEDFELWRTQAMAASLPNEVSSGYNLGFGLLRLNPDTTPQAFLAQRDNQIVAGLAHIYDAQDRCLRIIDAFATDDLSTGALLARAAQLAHTQLNAAQIEIDVLMTSPRLLRSAEQLGFAPVAYLPALYLQGNQCADVVKMAKLNSPPPMAIGEFTPQAKHIIECVSRGFEDLKLGSAIINLFQSLTIFQGLGEGELRKIARLFTQKLFRPGETIFMQGERSQEAYIVMRGEVQILLEGQPLATIASGQIFGEQAFLDGGPRGASARASKSCILLVIQRTAFNEVVQREPHLGMAIMRNIALDLSNKLRRTDSLLSSVRRQG